MAMDVLRYAARGHHGSVIDDVKIFCHAVTGRLSRTTASSLNNYYFFAFVRYALIPESIYRYTRLFFTVAICWLAQKCGNQNWVRSLKRDVNDQVIRLSSRSFESTALHTGWLHPHTGLIIHVFSRLSTRCLLLFNRVQAAVWGYPSTEKGKTAPLHMRELGVIMWARAARVFRYVRALIFVFRALYKKTFGRQVHATIDKLCFLFQVQLEIPRREMAMIYPIFGHSKLSQSLDWIRDRITQQLHHLA